MQGELRVDLSFGQIQQFRTSLVHWTGEVQIFFLTLTCRGLVL